MTGAFNIPRAAIVAALATSLLFATRPATALSPDTTMSALAAIAAANPSFNRSWTQPSFCSWIGVTCDSSNSSITRLDLSNLQLTGAIPEALGALTSLTHLTLSRNNLTGPVPRSLANLTFLVELHLSSNQLNGSILEELSALSSLTQLHLYGNQLTGPVPEALTALPSLRSLDLSDNFLTGPLPGSPSHVGLNCFNLSGTRLYQFGQRGAAECAPYYPDLASCGCQEPEALGINGSCYCVRPMSFVAKFSSDSGEALDSFSANLVETMAQLAVALNVSKERVSAVRFAEEEVSSSRSVVALFLRILPGGDLHETEGAEAERIRERVGGNVVLPLFGSVVRVPDFDMGVASLSEMDREGPPAPQAAYAPRPPSKAAKGNSLKTILVAAPLIAILFMFLLAAFFSVTHILRSSWRPGQRNRRMIPGTTVKSWTFAQLKSATNNFSRTNIIGRGGFGTVYRGRLEGLPIAAKRLARGSRQGHKELAKEVEIIGSIHHRNLVELRGYCIEGEEYILVYDLMVNGSVEDWLFRRRARDLLSWPVCVNIIRGTASAIAYLHYGCKERIIHRDIKPANILLDRHFKAHVADFGLARTTLNDSTHVSTRVMGTTGYLAPEYASTGQLTEKSDVFSFGMLMLVILCHRKAVDLRMEDGVFGLEDQVIEAVQEDRVLDLIAPHFVGAYDELEAMRLFHLAILCIRQAWHLRPSMDEVRQLLCCHMDVPDADWNAAVSMMWDEEPPRLPNWANGNSRIWTRLDSAPSKVVTF